MPYRTGNRRCRRVAFCVRIYVADDHLGGADALAAAAKALGARGIGLVLDFVPNQWLPTIPGRLSDRNCSWRELRRTWRRTHSRSSRVAERVLPTDVTRISRRGPMSCS